MFSIVGVVAAFWLALVFERWPFVLIPNRIIATAALLVGVWAIGLVLYYGLCSFSFLPALIRTPQTPTGLFNTWDTLVFLVTAITGMFLPLASSSATRLACSPSSRPCLGARSSSLMTPASEATAVMSAVS